MERESLRGPYGNGGVELKFSGRETVFNPAVVELIHQALKTTSIEKTKDGWKLTAAGAKRSFELELLTPFTRLNRKINGAVRYTSFDGEDVHELGGVRELEILNKISVGFRQGGENGSSLQIRTNGTVESHSF